MNIESFVRTVRIGVCVRVRTKIQPFILYSIEGLRCTVN